MFLNSVAAQTTTGGAAGGWQMLLPLVVVFGVMYFLIIRPQNRKMKEQQNMQSSVKVGDTITTTGGLIGRITKLEEAEVHVDFSKSGQSVRLLRSAIGAIINPTAKAKEMTQRKVSSPSKVKGEDKSDKSDQKPRQRKAPTKGRARSGAEVVRKSTNKPTSE